jgi:hypothetical protein
LFAGNLLPNNAASLRPPQIISWKIGSNTTGESEPAITPYIKHQTPNINHPFHPGLAFGKIGSKSNDELAPNIGLTSNFKHLGLLNR